MNHPLAQAMAERISAKLARGTVTTPSKWAKKYRVMTKQYPGPWSFEHFPWLLPMHDTSAQFVVGMKAAQMGFTEWALNVTFYNIDVKGIDCLYVLPTDGDAGDFSAGRFDPALEASPHLKNLFSDVKNVGHKRAGTSNLYVRGSRSRSKLKSIPVGDITFDEVDEMVQDNIPLAMERTSGQLAFTVRMISTPTVEKDGYGINGYFQQSTQDHFVFPCPHCDKYIEFTLDNLVIADKIHESFYRCTLCGGILNHADKVHYLRNAVFTPTVHSIDGEAPRIQGYTINQLYSMAETGKPENIAQTVVDAEKDPAKEQELYNSKLALPHTVAGARVEEITIDKCITNYLYPAKRSTKSWVTLGVDVGKYLYYVIKEYTLYKRGLDISSITKSKFLTAGTCLEFDNLDPLFKEFGIDYAIVDRHPETRSAYQFAMRHPGRVLLCMYGRSVMGRQLHTNTESELSVTVDRTSWIDQTLQRLNNSTAALPKNLPTEYRVHLRNIVRHYGTDAYGNMFITYKAIGPEHYVHAETYSEIGLPFAAEISGHQNVNKVQ